MRRRQTRGASLLVDLTFPGIGRVALVSGAHTQAEHRKRVALLQHLYARVEYWDLLRAIKDRRFTIAEVYEAFHRGRLDRLSGDVALHEDLAQAMARWLPTSAPASATRTRYAVSWHELERSAVLPAGATVRALGDVSWSALKARWSGGAYDWLHLRGMVSRFLSVTLGDVWHPFRRQLLKTFPGAQPAPRVPDLTPETFWRVVELLPEHVRAVPVALVLTGMRIGELCACTAADLLPLTHQVRIPGRTMRAEFKSRADVLPVDPRAWSWVTRAIPVGLSHWTIRDHWRQACAATDVRGVTLHDLRHCHAQWLINAGRPESAVQQSLRHRTAGMTRRYVTQVERGHNAVAIADLLAAAHGLTHGAKSRRSRKRA